MTSKKYIRTKSRKNPIVQLFLTIVLFYTVMIICGNFIGKAEVTTETPGYDSDIVNQPIKTPPKVVYKTVTTYKPIDIAAKIGQTVYARKTAGGKNMVIKRKIVKLKKGKTITVTGQSFKKKAVWYQISFRYKGKAKSAYLEADEVKLNPKPSAAAIISNVPKSTAVYGKTSPSAKPLIISGKKVRLKKNTAVSIRRDQTKKRIKWFQISFAYKNQSRTGYVKAKSTRLTKTKLTIRKPFSTLTAAQFEAYLTQEGFPDSYKPALRALHNAYPFWQFSAYHTNLQWSTVINKESEPGKNLLPNSYGADWKSKDSGAYNPSTGKYIVYDGSSWVTASRKAVAYYMDPRNFLTVSGLFQFELLGYQQDYQTAAGVDNIMKNTPFREGKTFTYYDGVPAVSKTITYTDALMSAGRISGVSPYHLAARIRQEVVLGLDTVSNAVTGRTAEYPGIYNFYNIGANDGKNPVLNGLLWASGGKQKQTDYMRPWNNPYKSIVGGAAYIGSGYINRGQNTLYLQKFNVTERDRYSHQYMSNIEAPYSESMNTRKAYGSSQDFVPIEFRIPVYLNMPSAVSAKPRGTSTYKTNTY
ncbi:MAG: hypothetical protein LBR68_02825 [Lachnoclostridium sp.]|jgi:beta-N-acetylglucosaminidase|nr:hypothetical protein [Lachnoclostridium sp.]